MKEYDLVIEDTLKEMQETEDDVSAMKLSKEFRSQLERIKLDLNISPFFPLTDELCKIVILAYVRSLEK